MSSFLFYFFSFTMLAFACASMFFSNSVNKVLSLVVSFFSAAILCILLRADFIATMLVVVYMGAIAMLFLFIVMSVGDVENSGKIDSKKSIIGAIVTVFFGLLTFSVFFASNPIFGKIDTMEISDIGRFIYEDNFQSFFFAGVALFVGLIGAVLLVIEFKHKLQIKNKTNPVGEAAKLKDIEVLSGIDF